MMNSRPPHAVEDEVWALAVLRPHFLHSHDAKHPSKACLAQCSGKKHSKAQRMFAKVFAIAAMFWILRVVWVVCLPVVFWCLCSLRQNGDIYGNMWILYPSLYRAIGETNHQIMPLLSSAGAVPFATSQSKARDSHSDLCSGWNQCIRPNQRNRAWCILAMLWTIEIVRHVLSFEIPAFQSFLITCETWRWTSQPPHEFLNCWGQWI